MHNRIAGKILLAESRKGLADLVVTAIEFDRSQDPDSFSGPNLSELLDPHSEAEASQRLGSVVTDRSGRFAIEFADDLADAGYQGSERRPDVVLYVQVPDQPVRGGPAGRSGESRTVFHTQPIRFEAGRMESFVILLDEGTLAQYGVPLRPGPMKSEMLRQAIEQEQTRTANKAAVRGEMFEDRNHQFEIERDVSDGLLRRLATVGGLPPQDFLEPNFTPFDVQDAIVDRVREALHRTFGPGGGDAGVASTAIVHLTDDDIEELRGAPGPLDDDEELSTTLCAVLARTGSPTSMLRSRDLLSEVRARRKVNELEISADGSEEAATEEGTEGPSSRPGDVKAEIFSRLHAVVSQLRADEQRRDRDGSTADVAGLAGELERIKQVVDRLEMSGGPTNVVAARDVDALQLAFRWVWTSIFDKDFESRVRDLYRNVVALHFTHDIPIDDPAEASSGEQLRRILNDLRRAAEIAADEPMPDIVREQFPFITRGQWARLSNDGQDSLVVVAEEAQAWEEFRSMEGSSSPQAQSWAEERARTILETQSSDRSNPIVGADELVTELEKRLNQPYQFAMAAPGHVNYGLMLTYRQEWAPVTYQVGELVETVPLAPGETREFRVRSKTTDLDRRKTVDRSLRNTISESTSTSRTETEALDKTSQAIRNSISTDSGFNIGIGNIGLTSEFTQNFSGESRRLQKTLQELTRKAADKIKREHETTVETEIQTEVEKTDTQTISNPNDEITVTYLLYELERRYQVTSRLREVQPVICVALEVPGPHEITEGWLIEHSWILEEALLDPDLEPLLDYLKEDRAGDLLELELRRTQLAAQEERTSRLDEEYSGLAESAEQRRQAIIDFTRDIGVAKAGKSSRGGRIMRSILTGGLSEAFPDRDDAIDTNVDILGAKREASQEALDYLQEQLETKGRALSDAQQALAEATEKYRDIVTAHAAREAAITRLQVHVRDNVYHYLHRIWSYQHADQRFFSLYDRQVPFFEPDDGAYILRRARDDRSAQVPGARTRGTAYELEIRPPEPPASYDEVPKRRLGEVADVDRPLGFRGNYIIFPLRQCCQLTDAMIHPYLDTYTGVRDPAYGNGYTGEELLEYAREVWDDHPRGRPLDDIERRQLENMIVDGMLEYPNATQEVTLPTGKLFMEAIKGNVSLLEDFKFAHRGLDVLRAEEETRAARIDSLRRASRIIDEKLDVDPLDVDKFVVVRNGEAKIES